MIVFNIQKYGDDAPYTVVVMAAPPAMSKKTAGALAKEATDLMDDTQDEQDAVKYLKDWGFTTVKFYDVLIGGNF